MTTCNKPGRNGTLCIRPMGVDDLAEVFHIGELIFTAEYSPSLYRTWDEYEVISMFSSDSELCLVAESDEKIIGFALGTTVDKHHSAWKYGYLVWLGVCPYAQKLRVGQNLFKEMKKRMRAEGGADDHHRHRCRQPGGDRFFHQTGFWQYSGTCLYDLEPGPQD